MFALADQLVGRADELGSLEQVLDELARGRPGAIELVGEPGIGKTRLLRELGARAELRGHLVLAGSASELERDLPFSVFVDALDEFAGGLEPKRLAALDDDVQAELAYVFPSLSALASGRAVALQHERYRSHRAVRALLEQLAQTRPLVLRSSTPTRRSGSRQAPPLRSRPRRPAGHSPGRNPGVGAPCRARAGEGCPPSRSGVAARAGADRIVDRDLADEQTAGANANERRSLPFLPRVRDARGREAFRDDER
jgi:hypothetical protein